MMRYYILDGNNIVHKHSALRAVFATAPDAARTALLEHIVPFARRYSSHRFCLVFDGAYTAMASLPRNISVMGAERRQSADDVIKELIRKERSPANCVVVSSDTDVYNAARAHACAAMTSEAFLAEIQAAIPGTRRMGKGAGNSSGDAEKPSGVSRAEIARMKKLFGLE